MKRILPIILLSLIGGMIFFFSCKKEYSCENCNSNKPPIADAGPDQAIILPIDSVLLDGSNSHDPDGTITSFIWKKIAGPVSLAIVNSSTVKTTVKNLVIGIYLFELKVTDNKGLSAKDTMQVIVDSVAGTNHPPVANAGDDVRSMYCFDGQWIGRNDTIFLDGNGSTDPDNNILTYQWTRISGPPLPALSPVNVPGHATQIAIINLQPGTVTFELKVTDPGGLISRDTVQTILFLNQPPVANAGVIPAITLPTNSVTLDGSGSTDPDNNIRSYQWTKISGPTSFSIADPTNRQTQVTNLVAGSYQFELKVTDVCGLISTDVVQVIINPEPTTCNLNTRPQINATLVPIGNLSVARFGLASGTAGSKILFAAGWTPGNHSSRVDIYDTLTNSWSTAELTDINRDGMAVAAVGNKIFFAGGGDNDWFDLTSRVDIYNSTSNTWSTAELSSPRNYLSAVTLGNKVFFAGGGIWAPLFCGTPPPGWPPNANYHVGSNVVDVYDNNTNTWSTATLSEGRFELSATTAGNKIYFAGGLQSIFCVSNRIDIYDGTTNSWSTSQLQEVKASHAGIATNNKIFWAAGTNTSYWYGYNLTDKVEIRNITTGTSSFDCITPKAMFGAVFKNDNIVFFTGYNNGPGNKFDIYNTTTNTWSIGVLPVDIHGAAIISVNNTVYIAGGTVNGVYSDQVWKLEF